MKTISIDFLLYLRKNIKIYYNKEIFEYITFFFFNI